MQNLEMARMGSRDNAIKLHGPDDFAGMAAAGALAAQALDHMAELVRPGVTTAELDDFALQFARDHGAIPCAAQLSRLSEIDLHLDQPRGLPRHSRPERALKDGDILNVDVTLIFDGWHGDTSRMYPVGEISRARPSG